jgi:acetoin utilization deacetylase AcuC-like enzyme
MARADPPQPVFLSHPSSLEHDTRPHPEQPARMIAIEQELSNRSWFGFRRVESRPVDRPVLERVHPASHIELIQRVAAQGGGQLDLDTVMSAGSFEAALHAAGGAVQMVELLLSGEAAYGFSAHRPPGHHATAGTAMGFCLFNNIAVAARHAVSALGCERVVILDWDVHHGNGTNDIFFSSPEVLFISIHQRPLYPGSGAASEVGAGDGTGFTVNLPVPPRSGNDLYTSLVDHVVVPLVSSFEPRLVLISAGYDAHDADPLADCTVTEDGFAAMTRSMRGVCQALGIPIGCVLEGGYALHALAQSVAATMEVLADRDGSSAVHGQSAPSRMALEARERLARWWPALG